MKLPTVRSFSFAIDSFDEESVYKFNVFDNSCMPIKVKRKNVIIADFRCGKLEKN